VSPLFTNINFNKCVIPDYPANLFQRSNVTAFATGTNCNGHQPLDLSFRSNSFVYWFWNQAEAWKQSQILRLSFRSIALIWIQDEEKLPVEDHNPALEWVLTRDFKVFRSFLADWENKLKASKPSSWIQNLSHVVDSSWVACVIDLSHLSGLEQTTYRYKSHVARVTLSRFVGWYRYTTYRQDIVRDL